MTSCPKHSPAKNNKKLHITEKRATPCRLGTAPSCLVNESAPQDYCYKKEPCPKGIGGGVATIYSNSLSISQKTGFKYNSFEVMVLHITLSREKSINDKSPLMFVLSNVYRPPEHHTDFIK